MHWILEYSVTIFFRQLAIRIALALSLIGAGSIARSQHLPSFDEKDDRSHSMLTYQTGVKPLLEQFCFDCHGGGSQSGGLTLDNLESHSRFSDPQLWLKVIGNLRAGLMPPRTEPQLSAAQLELLESWITRHALRLDPDHSIPGRVTLRRMNRTEYRNTVRDLLGVQLEEQLLPPDDVGYGFDNIGDVLSLSPMRLEKFIEAAIKVVDTSVPKNTLAIPARIYYAEDFIDKDGRNGDHMSFYQTRTVTKKVSLKAEGEYRIHIYCKIDGEAEPRDPQECRIHVKYDDAEFYTKQYPWADNNWFENDCYIRMDAGEHEISFTTEPVFPELKPLRTKMEYRIVSVNVDGPLEPSKWEHPPGYQRLYPRDAPPVELEERREYAREILKRFGSRAFRRPVSESSLSRLVDLAEQTYSRPNNSFEEGIAQSIVAILSSPKFLFHFEEADGSGGSRSEQIDEYSLAARLSFTLWRSIPDDELCQLAAENKLRENFAKQVERMIADPKSKAFVQGFAQQWLQTNAILDIPINSESVMAMEQSNEETAKQTAEATTASRGGARGIPGQGAGGAGRGAFGFGGFRRRREYTGTELIPTVREAMKQEVEAYFDHVMREDRSVHDFLDSDYTFVNSELAKLYGLEGVEGAGIRKVTLPDGNPRGGVLTMGSVLTVTSNPARTSPVKRGKWVLENILGAPTAPPPPDIPALEDTLSKSNERKLTQREALAIHSENSLCASCHARMDPLGLALENFNAFGRYRTIENQQPVDPTGELVTGERFESVRELKKALVANHKMEFYRNLASRLLTYSLGRGMEYYDIVTIDEIAARMHQNDGRFSSLLLGVLESKPFHHRLVASAVTASPSTPSTTKDTR